MASSGDRKRSLAAVGVLFGVSICGACAKDTGDLFQSTQGSGGATGTTGVTTSSASAMTTTSSTGKTSTASTSVTSTTGSAPGCGDGVIEPPEECDGQALGGHTCTEKGYANPAGVTCTPACTLDFNACQAVCGNGVVEPGEECDDGNMNNFDACSNQCKLQGTCQKPIPITMQFGLRDVSGTTSGTDQMQPQGCQQGTGPELVYAVKMTHNGFFTAWTDPTKTNFDAMVYAQTACPGGSEIQCGDNTPHEPDLVSFPVQADQIVYLVVDGYQGAQGDFGLHLSLNVGDCASPVPILVGDSMGVAEHALGDTTGLTNKAQGSCGGLGPDVAYAVTHMAPGQIAIQTTAMPGLSSVTYARSACNDTATEIVCNASNGNGDSAITLPAVMAGVLPTTVWVDSKSGTAGPYDVSFTP